MEISLSLVLTRISAVSAFLQSTFYFASALSAIFPVLQRLKSIESVFLSKFLSFFLFFFLSRTGVRIRSINHSFIWSRTLCKVSVSGRRVVNPILRIRQFSPLLPIKAELPYHTISLDLFQVSRPVAKTQQVQLPRQWTLCSCSWNVNLLFKGLHHLGIGSIMPICVGSCFFNVVCGTYQSIGLFTSLHVGRLEM